MKKLLLLLSIVVLGFNFNAKAEQVNWLEDDIPIYWAEADMGPIEGCCATVYVRVYRLYNGQTTQIYNGSYYVGLDGPGCCPAQGILEGDPNNTDGFYEFYFASVENKSMIDAVVAEALLENPSKKEFTPSSNLDLTLYPNPANLNLTVKLPTGELQWVKYTLFNSVGEPIIIQGRRPVEGGYIEILLSRITESGVYFLELEINGVRDIRTVQIVR